MEERESLFRRTFQRRINGLCDALLPHIGYYAEGRQRVRTAPARWLWITLSRVAR